MPAWLFTAVPLFATDKVALDFATGTPLTLGGYTVGWSFHLTSQITVQSLGWFDAGSDGLTSAHTVGLFTRPASGAGTLLSSVVVNSGDSLINGFRYTPVSPFALMPGDYVVAGTSGSDAFQTFCTGLTTAPEITYTRRALPAKRGADLPHRPVGPRDLLLRRELYLWVGTSSASSCRDHFHLDFPNERELERELQLDELSVGRRLSK